MLVSMLSDTFRIARARWKALLAVAIATGLAYSLILFFANTMALADGDVSPGGAVLLTLLLMGVSCWGTLAGVRVPLRNDLVGEALGGAIGDAPKLLASSIVLVVLVLPLVFVFPMIVVVGAIAAGEGLGIRPALRFGIAQFLRNFGAYVALLLVAIVVLAVNGALLLAGIAASTGVPTADDVRSLDAASELLLDAWYGLIGGWLVASMFNGIVWPAFIAATWKAFDSRGAADEWVGEDLEAQTVTAEISPAVAALLGEAPGGRRRRLQIPPRAAQAGRLPGPGVHSVVDVTLPAGATGRPVDSPSLELDAFDSGSTGGTGVVTPVTPAMWVSSQAVQNAAAPWKRLAAGFEESGLWPLLLPEVDFGLAEPWTEQRARRERDSLDASPEELLRSRLEGSLKGSPLASTQRIGASGVLRGELTRGSGRRRDALQFAFDELGDSRLALVAVTRPGDAVHRTAWPGTYAAGITGVELAELLVSWEERWDALLVGMTSASIVLAVLSPPATLDEAVEAAAEHHALCPDEADDWGDDSTYAQTLVDAPVWRLTWT